MKTFLSFINEKNEDINDLIIVITSICFDRNKYIKSEDIQKERAKEHNLKIIQNDGAHLYHLQGSLKNCISFLEDTEWLLRKSPEQLLGMKISKDHMTIHIQEKLIKSKYAKYIPLDKWSPEIKNKYKYLFSMNKANII